MHRVLIIEDEDGLRENLEELLEAEGFAVRSAADGKTGVAQALAEPPDVVVCDIMMPVMDGFRVLETLRDHPSTAAVPFIFLSARAERSDVRAGMSLGADDYVTKPFARQDILASIRSRLARHEELRHALAPPASEAPAVGDDLIVRSDALSAAWDRARRAAASDLSVLLLGETGVGKDVFAHAIHRASPRASKPFVPLHCAALAPNLLESELFGHEKGAFTGAAGSRPGLFEAADGGTVFLDEIGEIPMEIQVKLLRVLEDRTIRRVGGRSPREVDIRFLAATNRSLEEAVERGTFRADLYFRIAGVVVDVPPLRRRRADIVPLAERFVANACRRLGRPAPPVLSLEARAVLVAHDWPGNVRELRNAVEQAVALHDGDTLEEDAFSLRSSDAAPRGATLKDQLRELERQRIVDALAAHAGNQTQAARSLGMSRRTFVNRLDDFGLPRPRKD